MKAPFGQLCIDIHYLPVFKIFDIVSVWVNKKALYLSASVSNAVQNFHFNTATYFAVNLTFVKFNLSGFCFQNGKKHCGNKNHFSDTVEVHRMSHDKFFFCLSRSKWSLFLESEFTILVKQCHFFCHELQSLVSYVHQIFGANTIGTTADEFHQVACIDQGFLVFSQHVFAQSHMKVVHVFITGKKYQHITLSMEATEKIFFPSETFLETNHLLKSHLFLIKYFYCFFTVVHDLTATTNFSYQDNMDPEQSAFHSEIFCKYFLCFEQQKSQILSENSSVDNFREALCQNYTAESTVWKLLSLFLWWNCSV